MHLKEKKKKKNRKGTPTQKNPNTLNPQLLGTVSSQLAL